MSFTLNNDLPPAAVVIPLFAASAILLEIPPLLWHIKKRNFGASCIIVYFFLLQLMAFVNAIIWPRDTSLQHYSGVGLCDIEIRLQLMAYIGIPGCIFCIIRRLVGILDSDRSAGGRDTSARRLLLEDAFACLGFPLIVNALYYIVQSNRFVLFTVAGCKWSIAYSWPSILVVQIWPIILSIVNASLAVVVVYRLHKYRSGLSALMSGSSTTRSGFMRLFFTSVVLILVVLPIAIQALVVPLKKGYTAFDWHAIHDVDWEPIRIPTSGHVDWYEADAIMSIIGGYLVFICFGLGTDAVKMYRTWAKKLGVLKLLPCLWERRPFGSSSRTEESMNSSMASASRRIMITTVHESKSGPTSPTNGELQPSFLSFDLENGKPSLDSCSNIV